MPLFDDSVEDLLGETICLESDSLRMKLREAQKTPACLVIIHGNPLGKQFLLTCQDILIGRQIHCGIYINQEAISRSHARVLQDEGGRFTITDLGSKNGTRVNDQELSSDEPFPLRDGDFVRLGNIILKFIAEGSFENVFHAEMKNLASVDDLTKVYNKKSIMGSLEEGFKVAKIMGDPFSVIIFDIDNFKSINDQFGHATGDYVLSEIPKALYGVTRQHDHVGRFGGDEFLIVLRNTTLSSACGIAERIKSKVEKRTFRHGEEEFRITVSLGVASADSSTQSADCLFESADRANYNAKRDGGNRVAGY
jgi:two-component system, cell cycle response regulator